jgi:hypothetical protein
VGSFLRTGPKPRRVQVMLPFPTRSDAIYEVVVSSGEDVRITVDGRDGLAMKPDGSVTINLEVLLSAKEER